MTVILLSVKIICAPFTYNFVSVILGAGTTRTSDVYLDFSLVATQRAAIYKHTFFRRGAFVCSADISTLYNPKANNYFEIGGARTARTSDAVFITNTTFFSAPKLILVITWILVKKFQPRF
jgi:hypothetical protein